MSNVCIDNNEICLRVDTFKRMQNIIQKKYNLKHEPSLIEIKKILGITDSISLENRISEFLQDDISSDFKLKVPNIYSNGLSGASMIKIFDKLYRHYPIFHYRGPCFLDYESSYLYNYSDFHAYPLFMNNDYNYNIYYILLLTINSTNITPGHWIGICVVDNAIIYYDSLNGQIREPYQKLINLIALELKLSHPEIVSWRNNKKTQVSGKHCGVFQIHFLTTILELYTKKRLFNNNKLNTEELSYILQDGLTQETIEKTISNYFFINM